MADFERARTHMVDSQLRTSAVMDRRVLAQMGSVPRELFVPAARRPIAYIDDIHWLGEPAGRRFMAAPATLGRMLQLAQITDTESVLDIGAATGYSTAVIAGLAGTVVGLEWDAALAATAQANLLELGITNARIVAGDIAAVGRAQFDVILAQGSLDSVPEAFFATLRDGGRLVALIRTGSVAVAHVFVKSGSDIAARGEFNAMMPPLFLAPSGAEFVF